MITYRMKKYGRFDWRWAVVNRDTLVRGRCWTRRGAWRRIEAHVRLMGAAEFAAVGAK